MGAAATITHGDQTQAVNVCGGGGFPLRRIAACPTCKQRRRFAGLDSGPYYGVAWTCCACGDSWADGERLERPFLRGWRGQGERPRPGRVGAWPAAR